MNFDQLSGYLLGVGVISTFLYVPGTMIYNRNTDPVISGIGGRVISASVSGHHRNYGLPDLSVINIPSNEGKTTFDLQTGVATYEGEGEYCLTMGVPKFLTTTYDPNSADCDQRSITVRYYPPAHAPVIDGVPGEVTSVSIPRTVWDGFSLSYDLKDLAVVQVPAGQGKTILQDEGTAKYKGPIQYCTGPEAMGRQDLSLTKYVPTDHTCDERVGKIIYKPLK